MPKTPFERALEIAILQLIMTAVEHNMSIQEVLNALERVRFTTTELALEVQKHGA